MNILKKFLLLQLLFFIPLFSFCQCSPSPFLPMFIFYENFDDTTTCMTQGGQTAWEYGNQTTAIPGFATGAAANISNLLLPGVSGGATFIGIDGSDNTNGMMSTLTSPSIDISTYYYQNYPFVLEYSFFSNNTIDAAQNKLLVEISDGNNWIPVDSSQGNFSDWQRKCIGLNSIVSAFTANIQVRFTVIGDNSNGGNTANNDILIDNIIIRPIYQTPPSNINISGLSPTSVDIQWDDNSFTPGWSVMIEAVDTGNSFMTSQLHTNISYPYNGFPPPVSFSNLLPGRTYRLTVTNYSVSCGTKDPDVFNSFGGSNATSSDFIYFSTPTLCSSSSTPALGSGSSIANPVITTVPFYSDTSRNDLCHGYDMNTFAPITETWYQVAIDPCADSLEINLGYESGQGGGTGIPTWDAALRLVIANKFGTIIASNLINYHVELNTGAIQSGDTIYVSIESLNSGYPNCFSMFGGTPINCNVSGADYIINIEQTILPLPNASIAYPSNNYCRTDSSIILPSVVGSSGGVFSSTIPMLDTNTGSIPLLPSSYGTHSIHYNVSYPNVLTCFAVDSFQMHLSGINAAITSFTNPTCFASTDGTAIAASSMGFFPYTHLWSNGDSTLIADSLGAGLTSLIVSDSIGCSDTITILLTEPFPLTSTSSLTDNFCFGDSLGAITAVPIGGTPNYSFNWSSGDTTSNLTNLTAGGYDLTITDANACEEYTSYTITEPSILSSFVTDNSDGTATISVQGGTSPYAYQWSNNAGAQTTSTATNLVNNAIYYVTVVDANGCTTIDSIQPVFIAIESLKKENSVVVYPNPIKQQFFVELTLARPIKASIQINTMLGQTILERELGLISSQKIELDASKLSTGIYWLNIKVGKEWIHRKITVNN